MPAPHLPAITKSKDQLKPSCFDDMLPTTCTLAASPYTCIQPIQVDCIKPYTWSGSVVSVVDLSHHSAIPSAPFLHLFLTCVALVFYPFSRFYKYVRSFFHTSPLIHSFVSYFSSSFPRPMIHLFYSLSFFSFSFLF